MVLCIYILYLFDMMCYLYTIQVSPWADSQAKLYTSQIILGSHTQQLSLLQLIVGAHNDTFCFHTMIIVICFIYRFCDGSACAAIEYQRHFPDNSVEGHFVLCPPDNAWNWFSSMCFCVVLIWSGTLREQEKNILHMVQGSLQLLTCGTASHISMLHIQVWWTVSEEDVYPYLNQRVEHLEPRAIAQCMDFYHFPLHVLA